MQKPSLFFLKGHSFVEAHIDLFCCQGEENFCSLALIELPSWQKKKVSFVITSGCLKLTGFKMARYVTLLHATTKIIISNDVFSNNNTDLQIAFEALVVYLN